MVKFLQRFVLLLTLRISNVTDDMILVQLGTANPGHTEEDRTRWVHGLRDLLKRMREANTTNPNTVVLEIAKYRREFLGDPSKILNL